ncbi:TRAP-type C4-dicarboxylate transport system, small permease component [Maridesulfovibrio ferrireducens]|uniref:TRAP-type C4-dicarboxylate transport system, small permease component n=1 Tax=Maridesulfovibrio ferrireducens TaxID=246191 RepID=A0A1G9GTS4_9BACT|nr:TRAP transporter small permease [Maridesulfovibrio ferrireducens]SDL04014.1 TRAP-type C4-dicarboxylate transport system, small permease component [Maridesulfovibrio ferrireducens]
MSELKISTFVNKLEGVLKNIAAFCLISMALLTGADIISRGAFGSPIFGVEEIVAVLAVLTIGLALGYTHSQKSNIGVEFLVSKFNKKLRHNIRCGTNITSAILFGVVTWRLVLYAQSLKAAGEVTMTLELPTYMIIYALSFGFACFTLTLLKEVAEHLLGEK